MASEWPVSARMVAPMSFSVSESSDDVASSKMTTCGWRSKARAIRQLNELIHALPVPQLPFHDTLLDPEHPGRMKPEWTDPDGDHPSIAGYRRLGELAFHLP